MQNKKYLTLLMTVYHLLILTILPAVTFEVKQDGTGDFTTISEAVNEAVNNDTVLVYPGVYYESIEIHEKDVTLMSLYENTQNEEYSNF